MKKLVIIFCLMLGGLTSLQAQVKLEDLPININIDELLGKTKLINIKKGFNPKFSIGKFQINKVGILGEKMKGVKVLGTILGKKGVGDIMKLYKTYKTGLVVYKVLSSAGTVLTAYSTVRGLDDNKFEWRDARRMLYPALGSVATGVITKLLTKAASYKAVDIFNGVVRKKVTDILSVKPASQTIGLGLYVKL